MGSTASRALSPSHVSNTPYVLVPADVTRQISLQTKTNAVTLIKEYTHSKKTATNTFINQLIPSKKENCICYWHCSYLTTARKQSGSDSPHKRWGKKQPSHYATTAASFNTLFNVVRRMWQLPLFCFQPPNFSMMQFALLAPMHYTAQHFPILPLPRYSLNVCPLKSPAKHCLGNANNFSTPSCQGFLLDIGQTYWICERYKRLRAWQLRYRCKNKPENKKNKDRIP